MKKITLFLLLTAMCSLNAFAQKDLGTSRQKNMAIGVRVGDPTGLNLKKYFGNSALEFTVGIPTYFTGKYNYNRYYVKHGKNNGYYNNGYYYNYSNYSYSPAFSYALQVHFTQLFDIKAVEGLQWYAGGGLQFRQNIFEVTYYDYNYYGGYYGTAHTERVAATEFGLDGVGGAEYTFAKVPFSVFAEVNVFVNFINGARAYVQPGIGGRFNF